MAKTSDHTNRPEIKYVYGELTDATRTLLRQMEQYAASVGCRHRHLSEYFIFQTFWVLFKTCFTHWHRRPNGAIETEMILSAWENMPANAVRPDRKKRQYLSGELELEFNPQGTLAERLRAGGAGIPAFFTRTGFGTIVADGKETREFDGKHYVLETALHADVSLVKAWKADAAGNLVYRKTARNFNPAVAMAGKICIAEVEEVVALGELDPDTVHTPGIYVDRIVLNASPEKHIEQRTVRTA